jgi:hypothetical protein
MDKSPKKDSAKKESKLSLKEKRSAKKIKAEDKHRANS